MLVWLALPGVFLLSWLLSALLIRRGSGFLLDIPVERSAHRQATPRGGGIAIVISVYSFLFILASQGYLGLFQFSVLLCALPVAVTGFADDLRSLSVKVRLPVHLLAAFLALTLLGPVPEPFFSGVVELPYVFMSALLMVALVWLLNLYNFMDGIDTLAAGQCLFVSGAAALLLPDSQSALAWVCIGLFLATLGFFLWNLPPAKLFMGDVGSTFLGFFLGLLGLLTHFDGSLSVWVWVLLMGVFIADTTYTLLRRMVSGHSVTQGHSTHAYQHLSRRLASHSRVALVLTAVNVLWLFPLAWLATRSPQYGVVLAISGIVPLMFAAAALGAGTEGGANTKDQA
ncbi:MAG: glycosyltransferase family 4 protein [Pseudohongiella sp.]|uniref:glycosyltransferase family 4 protein n=1 Tax=Pseudohongiella sp. TaxID=1979412 RepID=UPI0034A0639D